jgi:hypothetical protein
MKVTKAHFAVVLATLLTMGGTPMDVGYQTWPRLAEALAATPEQKAEFQQILTSLRAVDTAYASGNSAEAQADFDKARSSWNKVSPAISKREAREAELLFDSLGGLLKKSAPAARIKATVDSMLRELREDTGRELR